jgi:hypothetical protein
MIDKSKIASFQSNFMPSIMPIVTRPLFYALIVFIWILAACTPQYDWREVRGTTAPFSVVLPAKPASFTRPINLDGQQVAMTMTAAEINGVTFAVGTATLPDAEKALNAISSMKTALVKNISGTVKQEKSSVNKTSRITSIELDAVGPPSSGSKSQPVRLLARFIAREKQVYQIVIVGPEKAVTTDAADIFFTSFKLN